MWGDIGIGSVDRKGDCWGRLRRRQISNQRLTSKVAIDSIFWKVGVEISDEQALFFLSQPGAQRLIGFR